MATTTGVPQETAIVFENCSSSEVALHWEPPNDRVDEGARWRRTRYATVKPGDAYWQHTYVGHEWTVRSNTFSREVMLRCVASVEVQRFKVPEISHAVVSLLSTSPAVNFTTAPMVAPTCLRAEFHNGTAVPLSVFACDGTLRGRTASFDGVADEGVHCDGIERRVATLDVGEGHTEDNCWGGRRFVVRTSADGAHVCVCVLGGESCRWDLTYTVDQLNLQSLHPYANSRSYKSVRVAGFRVMLADGLDTTTRTGEGGGDIVGGCEWMSAMRQDLADIRAILPPAALHILRDVKFYMNARYHYNGRLARHMCTHWSPDWLARHRNLPEKAGHVECYSVDDFLKYRTSQPSALLHELAHCYHYRMRKHIDTDILAAYETARASGKYDRVAHVGGRTDVRHYALTNHFEYFAECTEAFFSSLRNDYFPFDHHQLRKFDPQGYNMVATAWRVPRSHLDRHWRRGRPTSDENDRRFTPNGLITGCCYFLRAS